MSLFSQSNTVYVIDTSSLIRLDFMFERENPVFTAIWEEIEDLIGIGCFRTIDFVEDETPMPKALTQREYIILGVPSNTFEEKNQKIMR